MWNSWRVAVLMMVVAAAWGQNPSGTAAIASRFDTEQVRVYIATLQPHVPVPSRQGHATNRVLIYLDDGVMTRKEGEQVSQLEVHRGEVRWRPASGAYVAEVVSDRPLRILEVDLKGKPSGAAAATKLDPAVVDAKHYKVEIENDQVRVLRVHYEAHDRGVEHEHILNRVVLYLNDQTGAKADEVRMSGAGVHTEENKGDQAADRIAVEIK